MSKKYLMKKRVMAEYEAENFLKRYLPVAKSRLIKNFRNIEKESKVKKYPVVLKIISRDALHKNDVNGVKITNNSSEFLNNFVELIETAKRKKIVLDGILVQEFVRGQEIIIGIKKDETFGHVIMLGAGGVFVELLKDISFRACPITEKDANEMINELKARDLLLGFRGKKANVRLLKRILVKVSKIPTRNKKILELDINPFIINEKQGKVADARMVLEQ